MRGFWFSICITIVVLGFSQSQEKADSLKQLLREGVPNQENLEVLLQILLNEQDRDSVIFYGNMYLDLSESVGSTSKVHSAYIKIAGSYYQKGELDKAIEIYHLSLQSAESDDLKAIVYSNIGSVYQHNEDFANAYENYRRAIDIFKLLEDSLRLGTTYISAGYAYYLDEKLDSAAFYLEDATSIFTSLDIEYRDYYWSYAAGNLALVQAKQGLMNQSESMLDSAISILENYSDAYAISDYKIELAKIYQARGEYERAFEMAQSGTELAKANGYKKFIRDGSQLLSEFYLNINDYKKAFDYQSDYMAFNDSLTNADLVRQLANERTKFEVGQKQAEVDLLTAEKRTQRIITIAIGAFAFILVVLAAIIYKYYRSKAKTNRILGEQKEELERLNSTKDKFFSIISHDLRSPVAGFVGISQMIKMMVETKQTDELLEMTEHIDSSVDQLSKLLDNLLNWAMQQQGHIPNVPEKITLKEVADDLVKTLSNQAQGKSINLSADVPTELVIWSDKNTTMTIIRNLVSNALKFTPEGGTVAIKAEEAAGVAKIDITDTGVGMPKDKLKKLFQLQDKKSTYGTSGEKGLGLGLQLVHEFMEMNNGKIEVASEEGKGTTFTLWLPLFEASSVPSE